jgi:hypothetical protein
MKLQLIRILLLALALTATSTSVSFAKRCVPNPDVICPLIFDPVVCNGGVVYSNQCFASAACARGCRPA